MDDMFGREQRETEGKSFLDLPAEVRFPVYRELLVSYRIQQNCAVEYHQATLLLTGGWNGVNPSTVGLYRLFDDRRTTYHYPHPAILSTCRQIAAEAIEILYRENTFGFRFGATNDLVPSPSLIEIRLVCIWLYTTLNSNNWYTAIPYSLKSCVFAAFLNVIGPINARAMTSLSFYGPDTDSVADGMPPVTELVARYVPKLRDLKLYVASKMVLWDESPDNFRPDRSSSFWASGAFWPLYRSLEDFVHRVTWLKTLKYKGQEEFREFRWRSEGYGRLKALEDQVKSRAES